MNGRRAVDEPTAGGWQETRLVLVRHGESLWNAEGRVQGQGGPGLSGLGKVQAADVAHHLIATYPDPAVVYSSDLERVVQTAEPYLSATGRSAELDKRLREIDVGDWTGLLTAEVADRFPDDLAAARRGEDIPRGGGETFAAMRARVADVLRDIAGVTGESVPAGGTGTAVVFTHGGPIRVGVAEALELPPGGHQLLESPYNCSVTELSVMVDAAGQGGRIRLIAYNGVHLDRTSTARTSHDAIGENRS